MVKNSDEFFLIAGRRIEMLHMWVSLTFLCSASSCPEAQLSSLPAAQLRVWKSNKKKGLKFRSIRKREVKMFRASMPFFFFISAESGSPERTFCYNFTSSKKAQNQVHRFYNLKLKVRGLCNKKHIFESVQRVYYLQSVWFSHSTFFIFSNEFLSHLLIDKYTKLYEKQRCLRYHRTYTIFHQQIPSSH